MGRRGTNGRRPRPDMLVKSTPYDFYLAEAVESRFLELCGTYLRVRGIELLIPKHLDRDIIRWRELRVRHRSGDLRHTESEMKSVKAIAQWTLDVNAELRNQPKKKLDCLQ